MHGIVGYANTGKKTQTADTVITGFIAPRKFAIAVAVYLRYTVAGTAHTLTIMKCLGRTTLSAAAAASQAVVNLTAQPTLDGRASVAGNIATNDYGLVQLDDGSYHFGKLTVSSLAVTFDSNLSAAAAAGNKFWTFGAPSDAGHFVTGSGTSTTLELKNEHGIFAAEGIDEPLAFHSTNATAAGSLDNLMAAYQKAA